MKQPLNRFLGAILTVCALTFAFGHLTANAADEITPDDFPATQFWFRKMFLDIQKDPSFRDAKTPSSKISAWRNAINYLPASGSPVPRRYVTTCYGGLIDLRHFLYVAADVAHESSKEAALLKQFKEEGGLAHNNPETLEDFSKLAKAGYAPKATPEDLPSNAFGAMFGQLVKEHFYDADFTMEKYFVMVVGPLKPVPDKVVTNLSYQDLALGLGDDATPLDVMKANAWFTAKPMLQTKKLNAAAAEAGLGQLCEDIEDGEEGLEKAGMRLVKIGGQFPLMIEFQ